MLFSAFAEMATLGAILPFLAVLADPEVVFDYTIAQTFGQFLGITSGEQMALPLTVLFVSVALVSAGVRFLLLWTSTRLSHLVGVDLGFKVYLGTLYQPYQLHLMQNSSVVINGITQKVGNSVHALSMALNLAISGLLIITIAATLFMINPSIALIVAVIFGTGYGLVGVFFRKLLIKNSVVVAQNSTQLVQCIQEGVGGIRDILLDGSQKVYGKGYRHIALPLQLALAKNTLFSGSPRFAMEAMGMILIAILAYLLSQEHGGMSGALPMLGALALAAQRMLPNLQLGYAAWAGITGNQASLKDTLDLLEQPLPEHASQPSPNPLRFEKSIQVENLSFHYEGGVSKVLNDICFDVSKGMKVGIVGSTGSGKSTLLDILMGLLEPQSGSVLVDGAHVHGEALLRAWQRNIAHVPQSVFLSDGTLAENIAFGVPFDFIDMQRVNAAAKQAQLVDFIDDLELGFKTVVGERGVRLSGGQRQRIGIARALYKQASVIVFDEATSALDGVTERAVMEAIDQLDSDLTVLIIAHRLTTVQGCDKILVLDEGRLVAHDSFDNLLETSVAFQKLINARG